TDDEELFERDDSEELAAGEAHGPQDGEFDRAGAGADAGVDHEAETAEQQDRREREEEDALPAGSHERVAPLFGEDGLALEDGLGAKACLIEGFAGEPATPGSKPGFVRIGGGADRQEPCRTRANRFELRDEAMGP